MLLFSVLLMFPMSIRIPVIVLLLFFFAQPAEAGQYFSKRMSGNINGDSAGLFIQATDTSITGYYWMLKKPDLFFYLSGTVNEQGAVGITVRDTANVVITHYQGVIHNGKLSLYVIAKPPSRTATFYENAAPAGQIQFTYVMHVEHQTCSGMLPEDSCHIYRCEYVVPDGGISDTAKLNIMNDLAQHFSSTVASKNKKSVDFQQLVKEEATQYLATAAKTNSAKKLEHFTLVRQNHDNLLEIICLKRQFDALSGWQLYSKFRNYDIRTGDTIALKKLFKPGFEKPLLDSLHLQLCRVYDFDPNLPLTKSGFLVPKLWLTENYYLTENTINFYYNSGEVSKDAVPVTISLPLRGLSAILDPKGMLGSWAKP